MARLPSNLFFILTQCWAIVFWAIPEPAQKPFRILLLLVTFFLSFQLKIAQKRRIMALLITGALIVISLMGSFQTSVVNILLSTFFVISIEPLYKPFTQKQIKIAKKIVYFCCIAMMLQLVFFTATDGRPKLGYELNWSGAYLFLFFLYNDILKIKIGKLFVFVASMLLLSRLLILSLLLFYVLKYLKVFLCKVKIHWGIIHFVVLVGYLFVNVWMLANAEFGEDSSDKDRVTNLADGSNQTRFIYNMNILEGVFIDHDHKFLWGYGAISGEGANPEYVYNYHLMPHNELLDSIAEFGYIVTFLFLLFSIPLFNKYFSWRLYDYYIPLVIYTMILWARFMIVPSPEMAFILFLIIAKNKEYEKSVACY